MNYYIRALKKYAVFNGRATRSEYWYFFLLNLVIAIAVGIVAYLIGFEELSFLYGLAVLVPTWAVTVRRLHDIGRSGWMILISLIPLVGSIWLLVLMCLDSSPAENKYGPNPKMPIAQTPTPTESPAPPRFEQ